MQELFQQLARMNEQVWAPWQKMLSDPPWLRTPDISLKETWSPWIAAMRSTYDVNTNMWRVILEQGEEAFIKMLKESKLYSQSLESQTREIWESMKKVSKVQRETMEGLLEKMENLLAAKEQGN